MQKVRSYFFIFTRAAYKTTISNLSLTVLYAVAYILYLALEEGSPLYSNRFYPFYLFNLSVEYTLYSNNIIITYYIIICSSLHSDIYIGCSTFIHINHRISFDFFS